MEVSLASNSVRMLWCVGSRCWISTKAIPVSAGRFLMSSVNASMPPADAPMAAIRNLLAGSTRVFGFDGVLSERLRGVGRLDFISWLRQHYDCREAPEPLSLCFSWSPRDWTWDGAG